MIQFKFNQPIFLFLLFTILLPAFLQAQGKRDPQIKAFADSLAGKSKWLKITAVRIEDGFNSKDATNVYANGDVYYIASIQGGPSVKTDDLWEFYDAIRYNYGEWAVQPEWEPNGEGYAWYFEPGEIVKILKVKRGGKDIKIEIIGPKGGEMALRLKFNTDKYTIDDVLQAYSQTFAETEEGVLEEFTLDLKKGMNRKDIIQLLGLPDSRINFEGKSFLIYGVLKLVFEDGVLVDVQ